jgi:hypothetical protein
VPNAGCWGTEDTGGLSDQPGTGLRDQTRQQLPTGTRQDLPIPPSRWVHGASVGTCSASKLDIVLAIVPAMQPLRQVDRRLLKKLTAGFFVLLMAGFGFVQAVHVHDALARQSSPASHCSLCVVAHSAAVVTAASTASAPVTESALLAVSKPQFRSQLQVASSFIRPPPQSL